MWVLVFLFLSACLGKNWTDIPVKATLGGFYVNVISITQSHLNYPLMIDTTHPWLSLFGSDCVQSPSNTSCLPNSSRYTYSPLPSSYFNWSAPYCNNITLHGNQYCGLSANGFSMTANDGIILRYDISFLLEFAFHFLFKFAMIILKQKS